LLFPIIWEILIGLVVTFALRYRRREAFVNKIGLLQPVALVKTRLYVNIKKEQTLREAGRDMKIT